MKTLLLSIPFILLANLGCSFINEFDELLPTGSAMGGQTSRAEDGTNPDEIEDAPDTEEGAPMMDAEEKDDEGEGNAPMPEEPELVETGLIVSFPVPGSDPASSLYAISPQDGTVLNTLPKTEGEVTFAAHEAARDIWFLNIGQVITAATFDRKTNEWTFAEDGPGGITITDAQNVVALPNHLAVYSGGQLRVFDTTDVDDIKPLSGGVLDLSSRGVFWDMAALPASNGGRIYLMYREACAGICNPTQSYGVKVTQVVVSGGTIGEPTGSPKNISQVLGAKPNAQGQLIADVLADELLIMVPNEKDKTTTDQASIYNYDKGLNDPLLDTFETALVGEAGRNRIVSAVVDPCQRVLYAMLSQSPVMLEVPLNNSALPANESVKVDGVAIGYDHPTRSILVVESLVADSGIDSWAITGSQATPDLTQNIVGWTRPALQPQFIAVAQPNNFTCPVD